MPACEGGATADACQLPLAMAYVPSQKFENLYAHTDGWRRGTIFADLDKPYEGGCCK
ncbi:MAG: spore coat associated protein CotJA [Clostridia bacterium]|nr:spore coat associated protein CotJA [Clostridia bacterium]